MGKRALLVACGCMLLLSGCTKSNIVQPDASEAEEPDFNVYNNIELDMDQFHEEVNEICLDEDDYPMAELEDFLSVTDYSKTLSADYYEEWVSEGWLGRLANSEEEAKRTDVRTYLEMIITTPKEILEIDVNSVSRQDPLFWVIRNYDYAGFLHPSKDVAGNIKKKYDLIVAAFKDWGVDLPAIGDLYYE